MREIFKHTRLKFNELLSDARNFLSAEHNQNNKVYTPASPFGQILTVLVGLAQKIFYYIEDSITELNIFSASRESSIRGLIALTGYQTKNATSAMGIGALKYNGRSFEDEQITQIIVPNYTRVFCPGNSLYYLIVSNSEIRFSANNKEKGVDVNLIQGEIREQSFTTNGSPLQSFRINERFFDFVDLETVKVRVNGILYERYFSLYDMPLNSFGFLVRSSVGGGIDVILGTQYNGSIAIPGSRVEISYIRSAGAGGNIIDGRNLRMEFVDDGYDNLGNTLTLSEYLSLEINNGLILGSNPESIEVAKVAGPKHSRSFVLSNPGAYESFLARMNYFTTIEVFNTFDDDNFDDDNVVYMFLIPNLRLRISPKNNYFTAPVNSFLLTDYEQSELLNKIEKSGQVMIGTEFEIIQPTLKKFVCNLIIDYFEGHSKELLRTSIIDALSSYFINNTRRDRIPRSDLIAIVEGISGVDSVNIFFREDPANFSIDEESYINDMGDIIIGKKDYPLIRGGFIEDGIKYLEDLSETKPSSLNITFNSEVERTSNRLKNKNIVSSIRGFNR